MTNNAAAIEEKAPLAGQFSRAKGRLEFSLKEPGKPDADASRIVIHEHPLRPTRDYWMAYLRQIATIVPAYLDQFGGSAEISLHSTYEIHGDPRTSSFMVTMDDSMKDDFCTIAYDGLIQPTVEAAMVPNEQLL